MAAKKETRMAFIPELRAQITKQLKAQGVTDNVIDQSFTRWDNGEEPQTPWERGCFEVFREVQRHVERQP